MMIFNNKTKTITQKPLDRESSSYFFIDGERFYKHTGRALSANSSNMVLIIPDGWRCKRCGNGEKDKITFFVAFQTPHFSCDCCGKETVIGYLSPIKST